jgi:hypothetical protein
VATPSIAGDASTPEDDPVRVVPWRIRRDNPDTIALREAILIIYPYKYKMLGRVIAGYEGLIACWIVYLILSNHIVDRRSLCNSITLFSFAKHITTSIQRKLL